MKGENLSNGLKKSAASGVCWCPDNFSDFQIHPRNAVSPLPRSERSLDCRGHAFL